MNTTMRLTDHRMTIWALAAFALLGVGMDRAAAQSATTATPDEGAWTALSPAELETLVGPIALYPDDLVAVVLPASTFPLQVVQAARFLEARETNPELEPDAEWDDSIVALLNYPEALELLNDDLDWTYALGEAVVYQQGDVLNAVQAFRGRAQNAGNLETDDRQVVAAEDDGAITISPADPDVIYVPYYDPARVVVYQPAPVYHYYPYGYPVYYYPYPYGYSFRAGLFWGVTSAFLVSWHDHYLHVRHHSHFGHPYYGYSYYNPWYARTSIYVNVNHVGSYYRWRPSYHHGGRPRHYAGFSRLRDRHFVRTPSERYVRGNWRRDDRYGRGYTTPRRDVRPGSFDPRRTPRVRDRRGTIDDLHVRNDGARARGIERRGRELGGAGGRIAMRDRGANANRGAGNVRDRSARPARDLPRPGVNRAARPQTLGQSNRGRADVRNGNRSSASGRLARPQIRGQSSNDRRAQAFNRDRGSALGRVARPQIRGQSDNARRAQPPSRVRGNDVDRSARASRMSSQPRGITRQAVPSRGTLGRIAPQSPSRAQPSGARMRPGFNREQPMSPPRARSGDRSVNRGAGGRADFGRGRSAARSGGHAAPRSAGARPSGGGGRLRSSNGGNRRAR